MNRSSQLNDFLDVVVHETGYNGDAEAEIAIDEEEDELQMDNFFRKRTRRFSKYLSFYEPIQKKAKQLFFAEEHEKALSLFQQIVAEWPDDEQAYIFMSDCYEALRDFGNAMLHLRSAVMTSCGRSNYGVWTKLYNLAEQLEDENEQCRCLKALVKLRSLPDDDKMAYLTVLINSDFLQTDREVIRYQEDLYKLCENLGVSSTFSQAIIVARGYLAQDKMDKAVSIIAGHLEFALSQVTEYPSFDLVDAVAVYLEALIKQEACEQVIPFLASAQIIQCSEKIAVVGGYLEPQAVNASTMAILASICLGEIRTTQSCHRVEDILEELLKGNLLKGTFHSKTEVYLRLAHALLLLGKADTARDLILHLQKYAAVFRDTSMYNLLGNCYEHLHHVDSAKQAYEMSLNCRRSCRDAKNRLSALSLEFPNVVPFGNEKPHVEVDAEAQEKLYTEYLEVGLFAKDRQDRVQVVESAKKLLQSTFRHRVALNSEEFLWELKTPYILDKPMKVYRESCPAIAASKVNMPSWRRIAVDGARFAFQLEQYSDMVEIAFNALRTRELHDEPGKLHEVKLAIVVAAYHLGCKEGLASPSMVSVGETSIAVSTEDEEDGKGPVNKKLRFVYDYLRDMVNAGRDGKMPVELWNLMNYLIPDLTVVPYRASVGKFARHFVDKHKVFSMELQMIMANEALATGTKTRAKNLYLELQEKVGDHKMPWQAWLNLGIIEVQLACGKAVSRVERSRHYDAGTKYVKKYGGVRGVCQEVAYNKARAAHQFGDLRKAVEHYKECLALRQKTDYSKLSSEFVPVTDFTFRAAYNLYGLFAGRKEYALAKVVQSKCLNWKHVRQLVFPPS